MSKEVSGLPAAPCARAKATSKGARHHSSTTLLLAHDCCFTLLNLSFAGRVSEAVTPIFVPPVEMPAPCHVRLGETTLKPCEGFAVCRTRLSLPYVLRSTSLLRQHEKSTQHAKVALDRFKTGRTELRAVEVTALHTSCRRSRSASAPFWRNMNLVKLRWSCRRKTLPIFHERTPK